MTAEGRAAGGFDIAATFKDKTADHVKTSIAAGMALAEPEELDGKGRFLSYVVPFGADVRVVDIERLIDEAGLEPTPRRKTGPHRTLDGAAFTAYVTKHGVPGSEVWADATSTTITAVLDAHAAEEAGHGQHRVNYSLTPTVAWSTWLKNDRKWMSQMDFAEHVEDRIIDVAEPAGADLLEVAQTLVVHRSVQFESSNRLATGQTNLVYREVDESSAGGKRGDVAIPDRIVLQLIPFEGAPAYKVGARVRYRITDKQLRLSYALERPEDVTRDSFDQVVEGIAAGIEQPVWQGVAPTAG